MKKISLLLPTRKRPHFMYNLVQSAFLMANMPQKIQVVFYIDDDDTESLFYGKDIQKFYDHFFGEGTIILVVGTRCLLSEMWNRCAAFATGEIFMHCGDDIIFRTKNWDWIVEQKFEEIPDRIAFVYGSDGIQPDTFGTHGFIHRSAYGVIGYFVPPYFSCDYNDTWWNEVYAAIGRKFHVQIMTEHMHPDAGKAPEDITHQERRIRGRNDNVALIYEQMADERKNDAKKLLKYINNFKSTTI